MMARPRKLSAPILVVVAVLFGCAAVLGLVGYFVLEAPDPNSVVPSGSPYRDNVLLAAVGMAALGQLALVLALIRYYFTFFTTVSIAGCGIGSMALIIVLSVMSGFENDLRDKILGSNAHVLVTKEEGEFTEYREVAREIGQLYGDQFLNPPSTPMLIVDRQGKVHLLPFGRKTAEDLQEALAPFLDVEM